MYKQLTCTMAWQMYQHFTDALTAHLFMSDVLTAHLYMSDVSTAQLYNDMSDVSTAH